MERWTEEHARTAAQQGWCISRVHTQGRPPWQVRCIQDPKQVGARMGIRIPGLKGDDEAVARLRQAFDAGQPHALLAVELLELHSPQEHRQHGMDRWWMFRKPVIVYTRQDMVKLGLWFLAWVGLSAIGLWMLWHTYG